MCIDCKYGMLMEKKRALKKWLDEDYDMNVRAAQLE